MYRKAKPTKAAKVRCAIYTRKSSEEGLDLEFNSLDAQRESSEAFIASQQHEGWVCLPDRYGDGGFSGGSMVRPALNRLLADNTNPLNNHLGQPIGTVTTTTTLDQMASEDSLRDIQTSDRTDWRYDLGSGTLIPTERVQVNHHQIDTTMVRRFDTTDHTETESNQTIDGRNQTYQNSLLGLNREMVRSGRDSVRTATSTTPPEGAAMGVTTLVVTGTSDVSGHRHARSAVRSSSAGSCSTSRRMQKGSSLRMDGGQLPHGSG